MDVFDDVSSRCHLSDAGIALTKSSSAMKTINNQNPFCRSVQKYLIRGTFDVTGFDLDPGVGKRSRHDW